MLLVGSFTDTKEFVSKSLNIVERIQNNQGRWIASHGSIECSFEGPTRLLFCQRCAVAIVQGCSRKIVIDNDDRMRNGLSMILERYLSNFLC